MSGKEWLSEYRRPEFWTFMAINAVTQLGIRWFLFRGKTDGPAEIAVRVLAMLVFAAAFYPPCARFARRFR
jgi:uncharacterized membrane protein YhaH (DUF805 family)